MDDEEEASSHKVGLVTSARVRWLSGPAMDFRTGICYRELGLSADSKSNRLVLFHGDIVFIQNSNKTFK